MISVVQGMSVYPPFRPTHKVNRRDLRRHHLGYGLGHLGRWKEVIVEYQLVLEINPKSADVNQRLGDAFSKIGLNDKAIAAYRRTLEIKPYLYEVEEKLKHLLQIVDVAKKSQVELTSKGDSDSRIIALSKCYEAIVKKPRDYRGYIDLANTFSQKQDFKQAIIFYQMAIQLNPSHSDANFKLGKIMEEKDRLNEAIVHYKRAVDLNPESDLYRHFLELAVMKNG